MDRRSGSLWAYLKRTQFVDSPQRSLIVGSDHAGIECAMRVGLIGLLCTGCLILVAAYFKMNDDMRSEVPYDARSKLPEFERLVAEQRSRQAEQGPVRLVVYEKDHSVWVTTNSFEFVVYDETDKIDNNPNALSGYWPDPSSSTGVSDVGWGRKSVERIKGHFYHIWAADP